MCDKPQVTGWIERYWLTTAQSRVLFALTWGLISTGLLLQSGCQVFRGFSAKAVPAPVVLNGLPSQPDLLAKLNRHAQRVRQVQSNVALEVPGAPRLSGNLILERPNRLRLKAGIGGISEMGFDIGSNPELFWVWNKASLPGQAPPAIYYARQGDYHRLQEMASLPIDPQWIIDATGLVEFSGTDVHHGPYLEDRWLKIVTIKRTANSHITRVCLIDPRTALVHQQAFYDANNMQLGYINSKNFEYFAEEQVSLPRQIELHLHNPQNENLKLTLKLSQYRINSFYGNADQTWSMPNPDGVPLINLADSDLATRGY